ncbi:hypothetical protein L1049_005630 [Liquidambar formosana]|uniref:YTH domain-containing family protein n=1 Tax=Liquidambar formosana TaxID=63359 RepID=A0AAP0WQ81_LIQFO
MFLQLIICSVLIYAESLNALTLDTEEKPPNPDNMKKQDAVTIGHLSDLTYQLESLYSSGDFNTDCPPNAYAFQTQPVSNGGSENPTGKWDKYRPYVSAECFGSPDIHSENPSLMCHTYGYKVPSVRGDDSYPAQQFPISDPTCFQQPVSPNIGCIASRAKFPATGDQQGDSKLFGLRTDCSPPLGSFGRGSNFSGDFGGHRFLQQGCGLVQPWSDWSNLSNGQSSLAQFPSLSASSQPVSSLGLFGNNVGMASQHERPMYGFGCCPSSYYRGYPHSAHSRDSSFGSVSLSSLGMNGQSWLTLNKARCGMSNDSLCSCTGTHDTLGVQNRGPRATKPKIQTTANRFSIDTSKNVMPAEVPSGSYNRLDFVTEYKDAKFFIVKSYSEDNVHKSIKYGVWTSTPNGNKKLDAAYREAMEKQGICPIFLLFSANASAQFCGVAEMVGPVDFSKSVDYWQQDKWSGQFPVKWHIVKDVPNSQFRHIIVEKNDKKPVTKSRDTQEVELEQGIEMLNIFKNYESFSSILDDFDFYENRQKAMQERKAREKASLESAPVVGDNEHQNPVPALVTLSSDFIKHMSKSFAQAVLSSENAKEHSQAGKGNTIRAASAGSGVEQEEMKTSVASYQSQ